MKRLLIALTCAALVCAFLLAGDRPVAVVTPHIYPSEEATWSEEEAKYTYTITYLVDDDTTTSVSLPQAALPGGIPATIAITHYDGTTTVTMKEVERSAQSYKTSAARQSKVMVTYEGHVSTVYAAEFSLSTTSEKILISIDIDATERGIGPDGEGTTRLVPETTMTIRQVLAWDDPGLANILYSHIPNLLGTVNEDAWACTATGLTHPEGEYLLAGADVTAGRDGSVTVAYSLIARIPIPLTNVSEGMGYFRFYYLGGVPVATADGRQREGREILLPEQRRKIYPIAGTDILVYFDELNI